MSQRPNKACPAELTVPASSPAWDPLSPTARAAAGRSGLQPLASAAVGISSQRQSWEGKGWAWQSRHSVRITAVDWQVEAPTSGERRGFFCRQGPGTAWGEGSSHRHL